MKIKGQISILINREYTTIEVIDDNANTTFAKITLTPEQLSAALSRQMYVECELDVRGLDRIGCILRNDYYCKGLGQTQPLSEAYEKYKAIKEKRRLNDEIIETKTVTLFD